MGEDSRGARLGRAKLLVYQRNKKSAQVVRKKRGHDDRAFHFGIYTLEATAMELLNFKGKTLGRRLTIARRNRELAVARIGLALGGKNRNSQHIRAIVKG